MEDKRRMLLDLENLKEQKSNLHWILAGDFSIITTMAKKKGGNQRLDRDVEEFTTCIERTKLVDIGTSNGQFTWNKKIHSHHQVATRLDRFLVLESIILQGLALDGSILP